MNKIIALFAASLLIASTTPAQTCNAWKKTVYRTIEMIQKADTVKHHLTDVTTDSSLIEIIVGSIKAGRVGVYNTYDCSFTTKLSLADLNLRVGNFADTGIVVDPNTNEERMVVTHHEFDPTTVHKYRLLEEWTFDPYTGKTNIQVQGIAPIRDVYGDDGVLRGVQAMFWVRYTDVQKLLARYDRRHPAKTFASLIWNDYFYSDVKPQEQK